jgi:hypothetical protein
MGDHMLTDVDGSPRSSEHDHDSLAAVAHFRARNRAIERTAELDRVQPRHKIHVQVVA